MAAGTVPVRLDAGNLRISTTNPHVYQLICPYVRAVFDAAQKKDFGPLEGAVFMKCCDGMFRLFDLWRAHFPEQRAYVLPVPKIHSREAIAYFAGAMRRFSGDLGDDMGVKIGEEALKDAIVQFNPVRSAVREIYRLRLANPGAMAYSRLRSLIQEWLSTTPGSALPGVNAVLETVRDSPAMPPGEARILVSSSTLDQIGLIELIEESGITVIGDDHCSGLRHFDELVSEAGDPYLNLAERYLKRWPCARMQSDPSHIQRLIREIEATDARGLIYVGLKYCDQPSFDLPRIQARLAERHIPMLYIENDYTEGGLGQLKVRIEAFAEMLREEI